MQWLSRFGVVASVFMISACGGQADSGEGQPSGGDDAGVGQDANPDTGATEAGHVDTSTGDETGQEGGDDWCPDDLDPSLEGTPCSGPDRTCGTCPDDPCSFCNLMMCQGGTWVWAEAFPHPDCLMETTAPFDCGTGTCQPGEYCYATGCGVDGCTPPEPECRPIPQGCQMCSCLVPSGSCLCEQDADGGVHVDCPAA